MKENGSGRTPVPSSCPVLFLLPGPEAQSPLPTHQNFSGPLSRCCSFSFSETLTSGTGSAFIVGSCIVPYMMFTIYMHFWTLPTRGQWRPGHGSQCVSKYRQMPCGSPNHSQVRTTALLKLVFLKLLMIRNKSSFLVFPVLLEAAGIFLLSGASFRIPLWL